MAEDETTTGGGTAVAGTALAEAAETTAEGAQTATSPAADEATGLTAEEQAAKDADALALEQAAATDAALTELGGDDDVTSDVPEAAADDDATEAKPAEAAGDDEVDVEETVLKQSTVALYITAGQGRPGLPVAFARTQGTVVQLLLSPEAWIEFGKPEVVTATVTAGNNVAG